MDLESAINVYIYIIISVLLLEARVGNVIAGRNPELNMPFRKLLECSSEFTESRLML